MGKNLPGRGAGSKGNSVGWREGFFGAVGVGKGGRLRPVGGAVRKPRLTEAG